MCSLERCHSSKLASLPFIIVILRPAPPEDPLIEIHTAGAIYMDISVAYILAPNRFLSHPLLSHNKYDPEGISQRAPGYQSWTSHRTNPGRFKSHSQ
jgi:hypothetical protein